MLLSVIIPAYNEEKTLHEIVNKVLAVELPVGWEKEILICNDCSKDRTAEIAADLTVKHQSVEILNNAENLGKSQTVRAGLMASHGDFVVIQDADLEYDPEDLATMLREGLKYQSDVIYGNRFGKYNGVIYWKNFYGNLFLSGISSFFTSYRLRVSIPDMEVCYKMIRGKVARELAPKIESKSNFGFEPEITARLSRYHQKQDDPLNFLILPISYIPRSIEEGKKMKAFSDGFKALWEIIRFNLF